MPPADPVHLTDDELRRAFVDAADRGAHDVADMLGREIERRAADDEHARHERALDAAPLAGQALHYASRGFVVFPIVPGGKTPLTRRGLHDASCDVDVVARWWRVTPEANIGLPTGPVNGVDVVDLDGAEGCRSFYGTPSVEASAPPVIARVRTTRAGGWHLYVAATGRGNRAGMAPGVDFRGAGGYVLVPGSRVNGRRYRWVEPLARLS